MMKNSFLTKNLDIILILIIYTFLAIIFISPFQHIIGGDEISYINIAHEYSMGQWGNAINGYWSPLYSWLMVPFMYFWGFSPIKGVYISKFLSLLIGIFAIISIRELSKTFELSKLIQRSILLVTIPYILLFALYYNTPDLLLISILILYLCVVFRTDYSKHYYFGFLCGILGALAYFTKSFAFPFFLVTFVFFNLTFYFRGLSIDRRNVLKNMLIGLSIFFVLSGLWVGLISEKYGELTISTSGDYNHSVVGPKYQENTMAYGLAPIYYVGLLMPPNNNATSIWDDLTYLKLDKWSPIGSWSNFSYQVELLWSNLIYSIQILESFMLLSIVILVAMFVFIFKTGVDSVSKNYIKNLLIVIFVYIGGYCLIIPEWRYFWFIFLLLILSSFLMIDRLYKNGNLSLSLRNIVIFLLIFIFLIQPISEFLVLTPKSDTNYDLSKNLTEYGIHGNIASNMEWNEMLTLSYYLGSKYYGSTKLNSSGPELEQALISNNIDYYFMFSNTDNPQLINYHEITGGKIDSLKIYAKN